jgi:UrcA family protein
MMKRTYLLTPVLGALGFCLALPAQGQERSEAVAVGDLNLNSKSGLDQLDRRIRSAVKKVCQGGGALQNEGVQRKNAMLRCRKETMARAMTSRNALLAARQQDEGEEVATLVIDLDSGS